MTLAPGAHLGHYEIVAALGAGGMGQVYRARDKRLGRDVALKVLPGSTAGEKERLARFEREARMVAALNHPNIITLHSVEEADGVHFITMELVEGQSLDHRIPMGGMPPGPLAEMAIAISDALAAAHEKGIIHRDLKPGNVMMSNDGRLKVLDFGLAKETRAADPSDPTLSWAGRTGAGVMVGTPAYMSPEQIAGRNLDARADIFSLGVMLYEMATGVRPFQGDSSAELASAILRDTPPVVTEVRSGLPEGLARIIRRCLEKDPQNRIQTARDVGNEFKDLARSLSTEKPVVSAIAMPPEVAPGLKHNRWRSFRKAALTLVALASVALAAFLSPRFQGASPAPATVEKAVAVLPFVNISNDPGQEYFSDGMTEEIINQLAKVRKLRVTSRTSAMKYKASKDGVKEIARALGVSRLVEGSVRSSADQVRITVQLVDAELDRNIWSETYDKPRDLNAIFTIQSEIAHNVARELQALLSPEEEQALRSLPTKSLEAYQLYLRARQIEQDRSKDGIREGLTLLSRAVELDPRFLAARCELAASHYLAYQYIKKDPATLRKAELLARDVVAEDPSFALGHSILAGVSWMRSDFATMRKEIALAISGDPTDPDVLQRSALLLANLGEHDKALALAERAVKADPLSPVVGANYVNVFVFHRDWDKAAVALKDAFSRMPGSHMLKTAENNLRVYSGHCDGVLATDDQVFCQLNRGDDAAAQSALARFPKPSKDDAWGQLWYAYLEAFVSRKADAVFSVLERMSKLPESYWILDELKVDPLMDPYRNDPRYTPLVKRFGLVD